MRLAVPDVLANDGVYTTYFIAFSGNSRYNLDVEVKSILGKTTFIKSALSGNPSNEARPSSYGGAMSRFHSKGTIACQITAII